MDADETVRAAKQQLRERLLRARRERRPDVSVAEALAAHAAAEPLIARARRVAAFHSMPSEPPTGALIASILARGGEVAVPVVAPGHRMQWVLVEPGTSVRTSELGIPEPTAGTTVELATCDVVLAPALAVDHVGRRLGRGAGYYDRALASVTVPVVAVVFTAELLPEVPVEAHDVTVDAALTPNGLFRASRS